MWEEEAAREEEACSHRPRRLAGDSRDLSGHRLVRTEEAGLGRAAKAVVGTEWVAAPRMVAKAVVGIAWAAASRMMVAVSGQQLPLLSVITPEPVPASACRLLPVPRTAAPALTVRSRH